MFESLSSRLGEVFERLKKRGALTEADVSEALREVRVALLEADVALPVVKDFIAKAFAGSGKALVLAALKNHVSAKERAEIRQLLAKNGEQP